MVATRRKRRELRCACGGPLRVSRTVYRRNSVVRYRYCVLCHAPYKSVETLVSTSRLLKIARAIRQLFMSR